MWKKIQCEIRSKIESEKEKNAFIYQLEDTYIPMWFTCFFFFIFSVLAFKNQSNLKVMKWKYSKKNPQNLTKKEYKTNIIPQKLLWWKFLNFKQRISYHSWTIFFIWWMVPHLSCVCLCITKFSWMEQQKSGGKQKINWHSNFFYHFFTFSRILFWPLTIFFCSLSRHDVMRKRRQQKI